MTTVIEQSCFDLELYRTNETNTKMYAIFSTSL